MLNPMKSPKPQAPIDRVFLQSQPAQLSPTHNPVLPLGKLGDRRVASPSLR